MDLSFLRNVAKPTRYTGGEVNEAVKPESPGLLHVALAFPDSYDIGMSTMGLKILYQVLNDREDIWAERVFMPMPDMEAELASRGLPLYGLESKRPLGGFDVIGFTLQFELTYTNILHMLRLGGIPVRAAERGPADPVVLAGGPCAVNPEPLAPFVDAFLIGDGEEGALELCEAVRATRGMPRKEVWRALAKVEGAYVPALYRTERDPRTGMEVVAGPVEEGVPFPVRRRILMDVGRFPFPSRLIVPHHEVVHNRYTIEIARGCSVGCRFCQAGYIYRPVRERDPEAVQAAVERGLRDTGFNEVTLLSLNAGEYDGIERLVTRVADAGSSQRVGVAMPSLRVPSLTKELAKSLSAGRKSGFTLAPEAGTQRLRDVINKQVTDDEVGRAAGVVFSSGWSLVKLYFMIGLPTETDEDVHGIENLARVVARAGRDAGCKNPQVTLSTSCFVPKPFTPFQWYPMQPPEILHAKQEWLRRNLKRPVTYRWHEVDASVVEGVFSLGDRRLARVLERAAQSGCRFDGWHEHFDMALWRSAFEAEGVPPEDFLYRNREKDERLPWDHVDVGVTKAFLWKEWQKALGAQTTEKCGAEECHGCAFFAAQCMGGDLTREPVGETMRRPAGRMPTPSAFRYRLKYRKEGLARFIGHLDLMEMLVRALRRCGVHLAYSRGYHPMPKIELPAPLPLGVEGREEWLDFYAAPVDRDALVGQLRDALPAGLVPERLFLVPVSAPSVASFALQVYEIDASRLDAASLEAFRSRAEEFGDSKQWVVQRQVKGQTKPLDLKERVLEARWDGPAYRVKILQGGIMDLLESLSPSSFADLSVARVGMEAHEVPAEPASPANRPGSLPGPPAFRGRGDGGRMGAAGVRHRHEGA